MKHKGIENSRFLQACRRKAVDCTPVWLMRQAGRYMQEYRNLRQKYSLLTLCKTPELAAEVTLQPIRRFPLDAAIIFADILLPVEPMGFRLEFVKGEGPVIEGTLESREDVEKLVAFDPEEGLSFVLNAIRLVVSELKDTPLIGFAGAPFTLASYILEGGYSRHFLRTKKFMYEQEDLWHMFMEKIATVTAAYLQKQVEAGASVVQLFDSWVGILGPEDYTRYVLPYSKKILDSIAAPTIHFSTGTGGYLDRIVQAGGDVISVDWRVDLDAAWNCFPDRAIQGNLDPVYLQAPKERLIEEVRKVLRRAAGRPGHIFNLGHGVFPETPVENVEALVEEVHEFSANRNGED